MTRAESHQISNARAQKGDVAMLAVVVDVTAGSYTVFVRTGESVGL